MPESGTTLKGIFNIALKRKAGILTRSTFDFIK
jgi:hypothetical protein